MRKLVLGLLVGATALAPVLAQAQRAERSPEEELEPPARVRNAERAPRENRAERPERSEARAERRAERQERRADPGVERPRPDRDGDGQPETRRERRFDGDGVRAARPDRVVERPADQAFPPRQERAERQADRGDRRKDRRDAHRDRREDRSERRADRRDDRGGSDWGRSAYGGGFVWNRGWRDDRRYDWSGGRDRDRGRYRLPRYYAPGGYGHQYRRLGVGVGLTRSLYAESYWIDDPYHYRLPPAYGPYRWVRYYGDALLVDLRTGRVVDVVYDIFA